MHSAFRNSKFEICGFYSTLAGAIVEVIAGLFFWLYSEASKQINKFHDQLVATQELLTAIQIANITSPEKRDELYGVIIERLVEQKQEAMPVKVAGLKSKHR